MNKKQGIGIFTVLVIVVVAMLVGCIETKTPQPITLDVTPVYGYKIV